MPVRLAQEMNMSSEQKTSSQPDVTSPQRTSVLTSQQDSHEDKDLLGPADGSAHDQSLERSAFVMVGAVLMLTSAAYWTNQAIVNRYTYLSSLQQLATDSLSNSSEPAFNLSHVDKDLGVLCQSNLTSAGKRLLDAAQERTSTILLRLSSATELPAVVTVVLLGAYSDVMGRRLLFALPVAGLLLNTCVTSAVLALAWHPRWFFLGSVFHGLLGGFGAVQLACYTYAVDIARAGGRRTRALAAVQAAMGLAGIAAHVLVGFTIQSFWMLYPAVASTVNPVVTLALISCFLREMAPPTKGGSEAGCAGRPLWEGVKGVCLRVKHFYVQPNAQSGTRTRLWLGLTAFCFLVFPSKARFRLLFMYEVNAPLCWSPLPMGLYRAFSQGCQLALGYPLVRGLHRFLDDESLGVAGLVSLVAADLMTSWADTTAFMYGASVAGLAGAMPNPILRSLMSQLVSPHRQGTMFANLAVIEGIFGVIGQSLYFMYRNTMESMRGAVFLAMASSRLISAVFVLLLKQKSRGQHCHTVGEISIGQTAAETDQSNTLPDSRSVNKSTER